jgi:glycolate oxidase FAD binding subunit
MTRYAIGSKIPERVLYPTNEQEAAQMLLAARNAGEAVVPAGGATMLDVGNVPSRYIQAVVTDRLTGIVEYNPGDLTIVVRAGTTLAEVEAELGQHRQFLSVQAPFPERATIGGALAANMSGPLRLAYGTPRDAVIGTRVALPNGQVAKSGGRVVKNVAGYDLSKLFIGSFGTLGIIVEAAFKVFPCPLVRRVLVVAGADVPATMDLASSVVRRGPGLLSLVVVNESLAHTMKLHGPSMIAVVGGTPEATEELIAAIAAGAQPSPTRVLLAPESDCAMEAIRDFPGRATARLSVRALRPHADLADSPEVETLSYPTIGTTFVRAPSWESEDVTSLRQAVARFGGNVAVWRRSPALAGAPTWGEVGAELALMRAVKAVFDPDRIMSPGRFVGDI